MELLSFICKKLVTQEKVTGCFCFSTTITHVIHAILEIMTKFVSIKVTEFLTPTGSCIENNNLCFRKKNH